MEHAALGTFMTYVLEPGLLMLLLFRGAEKREERHGSVRGADVSPPAKTSAHNSFEVWFGFYAKKNVGTRMLLV